MSEHPRYYRDYIQLDPAGAKYLEKSAGRSRVFSELFSLSTFLVPRADRPTLPAGILDAMRFRYEE